MAMLRASKVAARFIWPNASSAEGVAPTLQASCVLPCVITIANRA